MISQYLSTITEDALWTNEEANQIRKKAYKYFLKGEFIR